MGCCCCCFMPGPEARVLPSEPSGSSEYEEFQRLCAEDIDDAKGWKVKTDQKSYSKHGFRMRIALRPHDSGNANMLLRGDGWYKGARPEHFLGYLLKPELPGMLVWEDVEELSDGGYVKYCKVKAPGMAARDHVWRYTVDKRADGSIFCCIRTSMHEKYPPQPGVIRAYYYNSSVFKMSKEEENVMEMTEFIFQDLGGGLPPCLMNSALPAGTLQANKLEMEHFRKQGLLQA